MVWKWIPESIKVRVGILSLLCDSIFNVKVRLTEEQIFAFKHTKPQDNTRIRSIYQLSVSSLSLKQGFFMGPTNMISEERRSSSIPCQESLLEHLKQEMPYFNLPCDVGLINVKLSKGIMCRKWSFDSDFLLDVTAVASVTAMTGRMRSCIF
jgi:hypothetical protein